MAGFWSTDNGTRGRRRLAVGSMAIVVLAAVTVGAVAYGRDDGDDRSGLAMSAVGQGPGVAVQDLPSPEEILAAVEAASAAADGEAPAAPGTPSTATAVPVPVPDPPVLPPVLPDLPGFPVADDDPATGQALVTLTNEYPGPVTLKVNGRSYDLAAGESVGPEEVVLAPNGNDIVEVALTAEPTCGQGGAGGIFAGPGSYLLTVTAGPGTCTSPPAPGIPAPGIRVTAA